jgi:hypothetical protein
VNLQVLEKNLFIKKKIDYSKTRDILKKYPIILLFQHNNCTVTDWYKLKTNIAQYSPQQQSKILCIQNSVANKIFSTDSRFSSTCPKAQNLFQGPNLLVGCTTLDQLDNIWNCISYNSQIIFVGGFYQNIHLTHLDLKVLQQLKKQGVYSQALLQQLFYKNLHINSTLLPVLYTTIEYNFIMNLRLQLYSCIARIARQ